MIGFQLKNSALISSFITAAFLTTACATVPPVPYGEVAEKPRIPPTIYVPMDDAYGTPESEVGGTPDGHEAESTRGSNPTSVSSSALETISRWQIRETIDPITDQTTIHASVPANRVLHLDFGRTINPRLTIACWQNRTQIYATFREHFIGSGEATVMWRIDDQNAQTTTWRYDNAGNGIGHYSGRRAIPLVRQLNGAERFIIRFTPFSESTWTVEFNVTGSDDVISRVSEACHWQP